MKIVPNRWSFIRDRLLTTPSLVINTMVDGSNIGGHDDGNRPSPISCNSRITGCVFQKVSSFLLFRGCGRLHVHVEMKPGMQRDQEVHVEMKLGMGTLSLSSPPLCFSSL